MLCWARELRAQYYTLFCDKKTDMYRKVHVHFFNHIINCHFHFYSINPPYVLQYNNNTFRVH